MKIKNNIKSLLWNKYHNAPNPIGLLTLSWVIAVVSGVILIGSVGQEIAMEKTKYIGVFGIVICILSWVYIEIKKAIKKNKGK